MGCIQSSSTKAKVAAAASEGKHLMSQASSVANAMTKKTVPWGGFRKTKVDYADELDTFVELSSLLVSNIGLDAVVFIPRAVFLGLSKMETHESIMGQLKTAEEVRKDLNKSSKKILFISHRWGQANFPDDKGNNQFKVVRKYVEDNPKVAFIWLDYSSISQKKGEDLFWKHLENIPTSLYIATDMLVVPKIIQKLQRTDLKDYLERCWCCLESFIALVTGCKFTVYFREGDFEAYVPIDMQAGACYETSVRSALALLEAHRFRQRNAAPSGAAAAAGTAAAAGGGQRGGGGGRGSLLARLSARRGSGGGGGGAVPHWEVGERDPAVVATKVRDDVREALEARDPGALRVLRQVLRMRLRHNMDPKSRYPLGDQVRSMRAWKCLGAAHVESDKAIVFNLMVYVIMYVDGFISSTKSAAEIEELVGDLHGKTILKIEDHYLSPAHLRQVFAHVTRSKAAGALTAFEIRKNFTCGAGVDRFLADNPRVTSVALRHEGVHDRSPIFRALAAGAPLARLDLGGNPGVGSAGARLVAAYLRGNATLRALELGDTKMTNPGAAALGAALAENAALEELGAGMNLFGNAGAAALLEGAAARGALRRLNLGGMKQLKKAPLAAQVQALKGVCAVVW